MQKINNNFSNQLHIITVHSVLLPVNMEIILFSCVLLLGPRELLPASCAASLCTLVLAYQTASCF